MKKKKSAMTIELLITMGLGLLIFAIIAGPFLYKNLVKKQAPFFAGQTEQATMDCDNDGTVGINDRCPCDDSIQNLEKGETCGSPSDKSPINCPSLCKNEKSNNA